MADRPDRVDEIRRRGGAVVEVAGEAHEVRALLLPMPGDWHVEEPVLRLDDVRLLIAEGVERAMATAGGVDQVAWDAGWKDGFTVGWRRGFTAGLPVTRATEEGDDR